MECGLQLQRENDRVKISEVKDLEKFFIISDKLLAKPIGFFGMKDNEVIGLYVDEKYRNKGIATDVIKMLEKDFDKLVVVTGFNNLSMQSVLKKLDYKKYLKYESM